MKVHSIQNNMNFKSGLTPEILAMEKKINPKRLQTYFKNCKYSDWYDFRRLDFKDNKAYALACKLCMNIFREFQKLHDYRGKQTIQHHVLPHDIYVFSEEDLTESGKNEKVFFQVAWGRKEDFDKNIRSFEEGTVFLNNCYDLTTLDKIMDINKKYHFSSTNHFLHHFVHEWLHAIQAKIVGNITFMGPGNYNLTAQHYHEQKLTDEERNIAFDVLGSYAAEERANGEYAEVFAEGWTKCICEALDKDCMHFKKDPLDVLKSLPKEFQELLWKVSNMDIVSYKFRMYQKEEPLIINI